VTIDKPPSTPNQPEPRNTNPFSQTSCMLVLLLAVTFLVGGLLGGLGGGGLVLWAADVNARQGQSVASSDVQPAIEIPEPTATSTLSPTPTEPVPPTPTATVTPTIAEGVSQVLPAVVTVVNTKTNVGDSEQGESRVRGSGTIVDPNGYVVTNYHVILGAEELTVILGNGQQMPARLVALDSLQDLALLKIDASDLAVARWGSSTQVRPGEWAIAVGSALGDFPNSVTVGVVSGVDRVLEVDGHNVVGGLIQTDAAINKGNSGGPLINQRGEVIGINTFIIREGQQIGVAEGLSFAIPSDRARQLIEEWIAADIQ
jgi:S1-C subfamily serine protease